MRLLPRTVGLIAMLAAASWASAHEIVFSVHLDGPSEAAPNSSPGVGNGTVTVDLDASTMRVNVSFSGLVGNTTAAHIHAPTSVAGTGLASVATTTPTFVGFPTGVKSGAWDQTYDMTLASSYNAPFLAANNNLTGDAFAALVAHMSAGKAYLNIHTTSYGSGEIRGFLVPEPTTLLGLASAGVLTLRRRR